MTKFFLHKMLKYIPSEWLSIHWTWFENTILQNNFKVYKYKKIFQYLTTTQNDSEIVFLSGKRNYLILRA